MRCLFLFANLSLFVGGCRAPRDLKLCFEVKTKTVAKALDKEIFRHSILFSAAHNLIQFERYEEAVCLLEQNIKSYPRSGRIDYDFGWAMYCYAKLGKLEKATEYYRKIRQNYAGWVYSQSAYRNWDSKLLEVAGIIRSSQTSEAAKAMEGIREIDGRIGPIHSSPSPKTVSKDEIIARAQSVLRGQFVLRGTGLDCSLEMTRPVYLPTPSGEDYVVFFSPKDAPGPDGYLRVHCLALVSSFSGMVQSLEPLTDRSEYAWYVRLDRDGNVWGYKVEKMGPINKGLPSVRRREAPRTSGWQILSPDCRSHAAYSTTTVGNSFASPMSCPSAAGGACRLLGRVRRKCSLSELEIHGAGLQNYLHSFEHISSFRQIICCPVWLSFPSRSS